MTFLDRMIGKPVGNRNAKAIACHLGINPRTAQGWWKTFEKT
jgi:hypothetical protein